MKYNTLTYAQGNHNASEKQFDPILHKHTTDLENWKKNHFSGNADIIEGLNGAPKTLSGWTAVIAPKQMMKCYCHTKTNDEMIKEKQNCDDQPINEVECLTILS